MPDDFVAGLEGVVAFTTEIAEPDKDGGALRYRGVDIEDLVTRHVTFGDVWGLLVDGRFGHGLPPAEPFPLPIHSGDVRVDVQAGLAMLAPIWGYPPLLDIDDATARDQLARASVMALSYVAQSARGIYQPAVPQRTIDECATVTARFMTRWQGDPDPRHVEAIDAYWVTAAEHGMNASTFTARVIASTGADVAAALSGAIGAMSGPLHGGAPARVLPMIEEVEHTGDARAVVKGILDRKDKLMGFGHRVYRAEDPRARVLRATAKRLEAPRYEVAAALEQAALAELRERRPDRAIETNVEFWAAVILDFAEVPAKMMPAMFTCGRTAGWCAHILEQKRLGKLVRPAAIYVGPAPRSPESVEGWDQIAVPPAIVTRATFASAATAFAGLVQRHPRGRVGRPRPWRLGSALAGRPHVAVADHRQHLSADHRRARGRHQPGRVLRTMREYASNAGRRGDRRARQAGGPRPRRRSRRPPSTRCSPRRAGRPRRGRRSADRGDRRARHPVEQLPADPDVRAGRARPRHRTGRGLTFTLPDDVLAEAAASGGARSAWHSVRAGRCCSALTGRARCPLRSPSC